MNLKVTIAFVLLACVIGVVVWINPFVGDPERNPRSPWFYQVAQEDIVKITVTNATSSVSFYKTPSRTWAFVDPPGDIPPSHTRWGGITLLLSGPGTRRDLTSFRPTIDNPEEYGLDNPETIVDVGLTANRTLQFRLGDTTTDGDFVYGQVLGFDDLFIITSNWGEVISRLAKEPPLPKWAVDRSPDIIKELNMYDGNAIQEKIRMVSFSQDLETNEWTVRDDKIDEDYVDVDMDLWEPVSKLVSGPKNITVAVASVPDRDYTPWGIDDDSFSIEVRFAGRTERGTKYTDGSLFRLGNKTKDEKFYYAKVETDTVVVPVLLLDAQWVDKFKALSAEVPYDSN